MNEEGLLVEKIQAGATENIDDNEIKAEFQQRLQLFVSTYHRKVGDLNPKLDLQIKENDSDYHIGFI